MMPRLATVKIVAGMEDVAGPQQVFSCTRELLDLSPSQGPSILNAAAGNLSLIGEAEPSPQVAHGVGNLRLALLPINPCEHQRARCSLMHGPSGIRHVAFLQEGNFGAYADRNVSIQLGG